VSEEEYHHNLNRSFQWNKKFSTVKSLKVGGKDFMIMDDVGRVRPMIFERGMVHNR
jgi:hypothetical protein